MKRIVQVFLWDFNWSSKIFYYRSNIRNIIVFLFSFLVWDNVFMIQLYIQGSFSHKREKEMKKKKMGILKKTTSVLWKMRQKKKKISTRITQLRENWEDWSHNKPVWPMDHDFMCTQVSEWLLHFIKKIKAQGLLYQWRLIQIKYFFHSKSNKLVFRAKIIKRFHIVLSRRSLRLSYFSFLGSQKFIN